MYYAGETLTCRAQRVVLFSARDYGLKVRIPFNRKSAARSVQGRWKYATTSSHRGAIYDA